MQKHVLLVVQNNSFPYDKRVLKEAITLRDAGYAVSVISPAMGKESALRADCEGIAVYRYRHFESHGGLPGFVLEYANALIQIFFISIGIFIRKPFRSIHVANPPDFFWPMGWFYKLFGVKFIFDQHDISSGMYRVNECKGENFIYRFLNWNEMMTVRCADGIITTNTSIRGRLDSLYGLRGKPCEEVYNGPSAGFCAKENPELCAKYAGRRVVLYIGEMAGVDCVEVILEAAEQVVKQQGRSECVFVLLGDGPDRNRLEALSKQKQLDRFVEFTGMVSHEIVMNYLAVAEVCLVPDEPNGLNEYLTLIKSLEYMKAARPFVAFDLKETRFMAADSALFARDIAEYVQHILHLLDNRAEAQDMGQKGKKRIETGFLWDHQIPQLLKLYERVGL